MEWAWEANKSEINWIGGSILPSVESILVDLHYRHSVSDKIGSSLKLLTGDLTTATDTFFNVFPPSDTKIGIVIEQ